LPIDYTQMHAYVSNPIVLVLYAIGLVAAIFHFTNGIFTFCITWGITAGPRAQDVVNKIMWVLCVVLSIIGVIALANFAM
ncbi:MAG: succinate dehydrogenase, partial [Smithella sp.]